MIKDDLWSDPENEFGDAEVSSELVKQKADISLDNAVTTKPFKNVLRKTVLKKVTESEISAPYLLVHPDQNHSCTIYENPVSGPVLQNLAVLNLNTINIESNVTSNNEVDTTSTSVFAPQVTTNGLPKTPIILEDLWGDSSEESPITQPLGLLIPTTLEQHGSVPVEFNRQPPTKEVAEASLEFELEDDLGATPDDDQAMQVELPDGWNEREMFSPQEEKNGASTAFALDFENIPDVLNEFDDISTLQEFENAIESDQLLNSFQLIDIQAELAELELAEEELVTEQLGAKPSPGGLSRRGMVQAPGWMGSSSVLYINWEGEEKAEQEALERLGYANLELSEATRAFVIQAARAYQLTGREERLLTARLVQARSHLEQHPDDEYYETKRNELQAEITDIERTLVYNFQWIAVKKAPQFLGQGIELDDLIQYGMLGIFAGIRHFDIKRKTRLLVVVNWWVFQSLARAVAEYGRLIRLPVYIHEPLTNIKKQRIRLEMCLGRPPELEELASAAQMPVKRLVELVYLPETVSLDCYCRAEYAKNGYSFEPVEASLVVDDDMINNGSYEMDIKQQVEAMLSCLSLREKKVVELRFGLDNRSGEIHTLEEIGGVMHVTRERVRQIEAKAFRKMKSSLIFRQIRNKTILRKKK